MGIQNSTLNSNTNNYNKFKNVLNEYIPSNDIIKIIWLYQKSFNLNLLFHSQNKCSPCIIDEKTKTFNNYKIFSIDTKHIKLSYISNNKLEFLDIPKYNDCTEFIYNTNDSYITQYKSDYYLLPNQYNLYIITEIENNIINIIAKNINTNKIKYTINQPIVSKNDIIGFTSENYIILYENNGIYNIYNIETGVLLNKFQGYKSSSLLRVADKYGKCKDGRFIILAYNSIICIYNANTKKTKCFSAYNIHPISYNEIIMMHPSEKEKYGKFVHIHDNIDIFNVNENDLTYIESYYINHNTNLHKYQSDKNTNKWIITFIKAISDKHFIIGYKRECYQNNCHKNLCILTIFDIETGKQYNTWASKKEHEYYKITEITNNQFIIVSDNIMDLWEIKVNPLKIVKTKSVTCDEKMVFPKYCLNGYLFVSLFQCNLFSEYNEFAIYN
jgi:hypothetical protein